MSSRLPQEFTNWLGRKDTQIKFIQDMEVTYSELWPLEFSCQEWRSVGVDELPASPHNSEFISVWHLDLLPPVAIFHSSMKQSNSLKLMYLENLIFRGNTFILLPNLLKQVTWCAVILYI